MLTWTLFGSVAHLPECRAPHLVKWLRCASSSCPGGVDLLPTVQAAVRVLMTISAVVSAVVPASLFMTVSLSMTVWAVMAAVMAMSATFACSSTLRRSSGDLPPCYGVAPPVPGVSGQ